MKLYQRDPLFRSWRIAAIYRCVLNYGMQRDWALSRVRELFPDGSRDGLVDNWFTDIDSVREYIVRNEIQAEAAHDVPLAEAFQPRLAA